MCSTISTASAAEHDGATPMAAVHPDIIQSHILRRLDGATLAATSCASSQFLSLCADDDLWREICNSAWPSTAHPTVHAAISAFPSAHRSFYSDSASHRHSPPAARGPKYPDTSELISAVDIFYDDELIYSKVLRTETLSGWFQCSPFRLDLLRRREKVATPLTCDGEGGACVGLAAERLRLSWILIDPSKKRAVNVASKRAVEARWQLLTEDMQLRYATVVDVGGGELYQCGVEVNCGGKYGGELAVRDANLQIEDGDGKILTGLESLRVVDAAMAGRRWRIDGKTEREAYEMFAAAHMEIRERKQERESWWDVALKAAGVLALSAIWYFILYFLF